MVQQDPRADTDKNDPTAYFRWFAQPNSNESADEYAKEGEHQGCGSNQGNSAEDRDGNKGERDSDGEGVGEDPYGSAGIATRSRYLRSPAELFRWTLDPAAAHEAVAILLSAPAAATGWGDSLQAILEADPRTRDSIWQGVSLSLGALADPRLPDAVSPGEGESFDPDGFLGSNGTFYLLATGADANNSTALVTAFVEDPVETARRLAARSAGARLDQLLLLALDEIGNLAPLPSLPNVMAEGGGTGITTMPVLQSLAQARTKWSENAAGTIWDSSIVKVKAVSVVPLPRNWDGIPRISAVLLRLSVRTGTDNYELILVTRLGIWFVSGHTGDRLCGCEWTESF